MKTSLRVQLKKIVPMSRDGINHWRRKSRHKINKLVFKSLKPEQVPLSEINTRAKIIKYIFATGGEGTWDFCFFTKRKNKFHGSYVTVFRVKLVSANNDDGYNVVYFIDTFKKSGRKRYVNYTNKFKWFYKKGG